MTKVLHADMQLSRQSNDCWSAHILSAMGGLTQSYIFKQKLQNCEPIDLSRPFCGRPQGETLRTEHLVLKLIRESTTANALLINNGTVCSSYQKGSGHSITHSPYILFKYMFLNLPRDVIGSTACFRLRVHTLGFETATWYQSNSPICDL